MNVKKPVMIMLGLIGVVLTILALHGIVAGEWAQISGKVTVLIGVIGFLAVIVSIMIGRD